MHEHIANLVISSNQTLYALKIIKSHGISHSDLINICRATLISRLLYASCAWCGFATQTEIGQLYTQSPVRPVDEGCGTIRHTQLMICLDLWMINFFKRF